MTHKERQEKISEAVAQIGRLVGACAKHGLGQDDILVTLQTATSLLCEVNEVPIATYTKALYELHAKRMRHEANR